MSMDQPKWLMPQGLPPGAGAPGFYSGAGPPSQLVDKQMATLGTTCMVLSVAEILWCTFPVLNAAQSSNAVDINKLSGSSLSTIDTGALAKAVEAFTRQIVVLESVRMIPFVVASVVLFLLGRAIRRGRIDGLLKARRWVWWAFAAISISLVVQLFGIIPARLDYSQRVMDIVLAGAPGTRHSAPFDVKGFTGMMTAIYTYVGVMLGALGMAIWPTVLWVWAGKLVKAMAPPSSPG